MKTIKTSNYKKLTKTALDMNRYESEGMLGENIDRTDDFDRVQGLIDKYNSYGPGAFALKEEPLGSEFYSLIKADSIEGGNQVVITQGDLFDIEDRLKQIIREHGLQDLSQNFDTPMGLEDDNPVPGIDY